jgi:hypothetical protein
VFAVGYRVTWHFAMNLLPMPFAMMGMLEHARKGARAEAAVLTNSPQPRSPRHEAEKPASP